MAKQTLPKGFKLGGSGLGGKLFGAGLLVFVLFMVITSPLESAHFVRHVVGSVSSFFKSI
ncbi:hypothetical protein [Amycolatopsis sp. Poz14]|uniref:hypothetical protein n=1 Tax=Amycolatopsis sp. Poz14 TaxID=1447705 RepID=UPI001EE86526|nr:hypothetical protein [Amycolatopsis sp. Poz14]MCG3748898.1 hypothetical protein [Amycolatopsis sp. Poz14]